MQVNIMLDGDAKMPKYARDGDAGLDLCVSENAVVPPHKTMLVGTGVHVAIPYSYAGIVCMRSGTAKDAGLCLANGVGLIDSGYRGEIGLLLHNLTDTAVELPRGERVAQLVIVPVMHAVCNQVAELPKSERGNNGFGSTGK